MPDGINYAAELGKLSPEDRESYLGTWRDYFSELPKAAYAGTLTRLTRKYGPEFTSQIIQPGLPTERPEVPAIAEAPAVELEPELPWYYKPIQWAAEQPALKPVFKGLEAYQRKWITPAAMTLAQVASPQLRGELAGRQPFDIPEAERKELWEEKTKLPWLARFASELAVDPLMYFGWGLAPKAMRAAEKAGMKTLAQAIKPAASLEEAYIKAAGAPIRAIGRGLQKIPEIQLGVIAGKPRKIGALFKESTRSMVNNEPLHVFDLIRNMDAAGGQLGRPLSQILQDIRMGIVDPAIANTITNPKQQAVLTRLIKNKDILDLDVIAKVIDSFPERAAVALARKETALLAKELGRVVPAKQLGAIKLSKDMYGMWKRTVLSTPWYVEQNVVENFIRPVMVGVNPLRDINAIVASPIFKRWPIDMQRRALTFAQRWNQEIPENLKWARSVSTGGLTESMSGALATGKKWPTLTAGATLDEQAMLRTFDYMYASFERELMVKTSSKTAKALAEMDTLWDDAIKSVAPTGVAPSGLKKAAEAIPPVAPTPAFSAPAVPTAVPSTVAAKVGAITGQIVDPTDVKFFGAYEELLAEALAKGKSRTIPLHSIAERLGIELRTPEMVEWLNRIIYDYKLLDNGVVGLMKSTGRGLPKHTLQVDSVFGQRLRLVPKGEAYKSPDMYVGIEIKVEKLTELLGKQAPKAGGIIPGAEAVAAKVAKAVPPVERELLEHLKSTCISGSTDDVLAAFAEVQRNKTMTIARAITQAEKGLPDAIRSGIQKELPRLWARNDIAGIERLFQKYEQSLPQQIQSYQKQALLQRLSYYKKLVKQQVPQKYQPLYNQLLNRFKYERVADREARLTAAKTLSEFESAMFSANVESMREMESLILGNVIAESIATRQYGKISTYVALHEQIVQGAFKAGDDLTARTFGLTKIVRHGKDPKAIQQSWDEYIMHIQSEFPDQAAILQASAPDNDLLWSTRRAIQDRRWFKVSQDELTAMQMDPTKFPRVVDAKGKMLTMEDYLGKQRAALKSWNDRATAAFAKRHETPTTKNQLLDTLRDETIRIKEGVALQELKLQNEAMDLATDVAYDTFGNYGVRTNLDDIMQGIGMPFWFFPSRSIPFYAGQMLKKPRLGVEIMTLQQQAEEDNQPTRLFGFANIPGTDYYYNPLAASMLWQLAGQYDWTPGHLGGLEQGQLQMQQKLGMSLGPQWQIATALVSRLITKHGQDPLIVGDPKYIVPQHRWLEAVENLDLPGLSQIAGIVSEPFDAYLRAVYGTEVAEWQKRDVEKYIVDAGYNPQTASKEVIQDAWNKYWTRQLLSIPGGVVKEMTPTEKARFEAYGEKAAEMGLTRKQTAELRRAGESPWTGLRQDQLESLFADIPAQKLWRYIRPVGLTSQSRPIWEDYIQSKIERETLRGDPENPQEGSRIYKELELDAALRAVRISPREWKSLYRQNYADYFSKTVQLEKDYPLAPKTEEDWEAYRELLGWDTPVRHPDDIKLDEYYTVMDSAHFEDELGMFDYSAYRKAEQQFFAGLPQDTIDYIKARKDRYKTPLRVAYNRDMEKVQPYYSLQDSILAQYPPEIAALINYASKVPDPAIQKAVMASNPQALIVMRRIRLAKSRLRLRYPDIDRILRFWSS